MFYCIGKLGEEPRFLQTPDPDELASQIQPGDVCFEVESVPLKRVIILEENDQYTLGAYRYTLQEMQDWFWIAFKDWRTRVTLGGFMSTLGPVDSTENSQSRVSMYATTATVDPDFSVDWTMADNTSRTLSAADILQLNAEMVEFVNLCHQAGAALRDPIYQTTSQQQLESLDINEGYPQNALLNEYPS